MDTAKQYFTGLKVDEVYECKIVNKELRVCKQRQPLQLAHLDEIFEAQMIEPIRTIPASCSQRIVDLNHIVETIKWEWTVICSSNSRSFDPVMLETRTHGCKLSGTEKLRLNHLCKAYGSRIFIQSLATIVSNRKSRDIIPPMSLEYDSCGSIDKNFKLKELHLHVPLSSIAGSLDDLKVASQKVEDVEKKYLNKDEN